MSGGRCQLASPEIVGPEVSLTHSVSEDLGGCGLLPFFFFFFLGLLHPHGVSQFWV